MNLKFPNTLILILTTNMPLLKVRAKLKIMIFAKIPRKTKFIKLILTKKTSKNRISALFLKNRQA